MEKQRSRKVIWYSAAAWIREGKDNQGAPTDRKKQSLEGGHCQFSLVVQLLGEQELDSFLGWTHFSWSQKDVTTYFDVLTCLPNGKLLNYKLITCFADPFGT